ncbi:GTPase ObgE [Peptostreptococcus porci]|uniref:GTPase ObgE n=1 Tax=Peptostreptococcus porci TaxID=2652282 RepID=UPI002A81F561|nr:GTPase ObgE [Peptostreptococcus porci]MDY4128043.1 GTPase ObgE [Peptostreptococcus porci]MDY5436473.1 GTPase ObgE [Peptostreptococcus porci]MDY6232153.1 GTPase ObgE [Peptostreptococcus porci]
MFVDKAKIFVKAGNGGNGSVSFRREKYVPAGGPDGGDGGRGGSIIIEADGALRTLMDFKYKTKYSAPSGEDGSKKRRAGKNGEDLLLKVPEGTIIRDEKTGLVIADLKNSGDRIVVAKGGFGGKGNQHFANAVRQAPAFAKSGTDGQERWIVLELKMIADVGLLGFPNVGKSTFLSIVTSAKPKIANYHFTTITPNLGVVKTRHGESFVMADIPGIIEGAADGVGLGHDFLRHVERTKVLIHIVDISGIEGRDPIEDFEKINSELKLYNEKLATRPQIVVANKSDLLFDDSIYADFKKNLEDNGYEVFKMSAATREGVDEVIDRVVQVLAESSEIELVSEDEIYRPEDDVNEDEGLFIEVDENGVYVVKGKELRRIMYSVNFDDVESLQYFQNQMESRGVFDKLRAMGIEDGDSVKIYELEFEFYN